MCLLLSPSHPFSPVISLHDNPGSQRISLFLFQSCTWKRGRPVTWRAATDNPQPNTWKVNCPEAPDWHPSCFPPPLCSHMPLMWRDSSILQESLAFRWLRGAWPPDFLPSLTPFLNNLFLIYICTTWPPQSSDLWLHMEETLFWSDVFLKIYVARDVTCTTRIISLTGNTTTLSVVFPLKRFRFLLSIKVKPSCDCCLDCQWSDFCSKTSGTLFEKEKSRRAKKDGNRQPLRE